jgi:hypothetical protein
MSPEQVAGQVTEPSSDVYSTGILLFEMLTGAPPFGGNTAEIMSQHLVAPLPRIADRCPGRHATPEFEAFLNRATAKSRHERFQTAGELAQALDALPRPAVILGGKAPPAQPPVPPSARGAQVRARPPPPSARRPERSGWGRTLLHATPPLLAIIGITAVFIVLRGQDETKIAVPTEATATSEPSSPLPGAAPALVEAKRRTEGVPATAAATATASAPVSSAGAALLPPRPPGPPTITAAELWKGAPKVLIAGRDAADQGIPLSRRTTAYIHKFNGENPGDPRGHLILARSHLSRGWRKDVLREYAIAYKLNPDVRVEPRMLEDIMKLVVKGSSTAEQFLKEAYGADAIGPVDRAIKDAAPNLAEVERLQKLRSELAALGTK